MNDDKNPSPGEPTEQFGRAGDLGGASAGEAPAAAGGQPEAAEEAAQPGAAAEQTSELGQPAPGAEQPAQPASGAAHASQPASAAQQPGYYAPPGPWGMPLPPPKQGGFRRFVSHRATQLVGVGVLGLVVGGGVVGGVMAATHHSGRPGMSQHQGGHRFNDGGPGQRHRVPGGQNGGNENNGPGFGNGYGN
ncbi:hypothetical protein CU254_40385 [Amycolatopsis sp. AA4]|uniref:hypothetical protein n=1 Tax=Actinomycetes TaxID=1760 RepID=UPI0001B53BA0|nr:MULTISPECIES: hypothetical protein [Actinomycetes]ATY15950.1 hypothetical protein CU254_40385 [Amycolatopsis sp. AA4]EFL12285.1 predicted protein [Streptomyces sp. AA4]